MSKNFLPLVLQSLDEKSEPQIVTAVKDVLNWQDEDLGDLAILYSKAQELYGPYYFSDVKQIEKTEELALKNAAYSFFAFATWRLLTIYE